MYEKRLGKRNENFIRDALQTKKKGAIEEERRNKDRKKIKRKEKKEENVGRLILHSGFKGTNSPGFTSFFRLHPYLSLNPLSLFIHTLSLFIHPLSLYSFFLSSFILSLSP